MERSLLTIPQVAKLLNVSATKVHDLIKSHDLRHLSIGKPVERKLIRIRPEWVEQYVESAAPAKTSDVFGTQNANVSRRRSSKKNSVNRY